MNMNAFHDFLGRQISTRLIISLPAGDDMNLSSHLRLAKSQTAQDPACGRMIRIKESVEEDKAVHVPIGELPG